MLIDIMTHYVAQISWKYSIMLAVCNSFKMSVRIAACKWTSKQGI